MLPRLLQAIGVRSCGIAAQLGSLVLLTTTTNASVLAAFLSMTAAAAIAMTIADGGFVRYSFRYINRGAPPAALVGRLLQIWLMTLPPLAIIVGLLGAAGGHPGYNVLAFALALAGQLVNLARYYFIRERALHLATLLETVQPVVFFLSLGIVRAATESEAGASVATLLTCFGMSFLASGGCAMMVLHRYQRHGPLISAPRSSAHRRRSRSVISSLRRSAPVGADAVLVSAWLNSMSICAPMLYPPFAAAAVGLLQRGIAVVVVFSGVAIASRLNAYYRRSDVGLEVRSAIILAGCSWLCTVLMFSGAPAVISLTYVLGINMSGNGVDYIAVIADNTLAVASLVGLVVAYQMVSFICLGHDLRLARMLASGIGLVSAISLNISLLRGFWHPVDTNIGLMIVVYCLSFACGLCVLLLALARGGNHGSSRSAGRS